MPALTMPGRPISQDTPVLLLKVPTACLAARCQVNGERAALPAACGGAGGGDSRRMWRMRAANTIAPPISVRTDGISAWMSQTQTGPSKVSKGGEKGRQRGRDEPRPRCKAGKTEAQIDRAEGEEAVPCRSPRRPVTRPASRAKLPANSVPSMVAGVNADMGVPSCEDSREGKSHRTHERQKPADGGNVGIERFRHHHADTDEDGGDRDPREWEMTSPNRRRGKKSAAKERERQRRSGGCSRPSYGPEPARRVGGRQGRNRHRRPRRAGPWPGTWRACPARHHASSMNPMRKSAAPNRPPEDHRPRVNEPI